MVQWRRVTVEISGYEFDGVGRVERSTHVSTRRLAKFFSVQRGTPRESDTASRREEACLLNLCNVVAQLWSHHSLVQYDMTVTYFSAHRRLELKSDRMENNSHPCAQRTLHPFCVVSHSCMEAEQTFLELGY